MRARQWSIGIDSERKEQVRQAQQFGQIVGALPQFVEQPRVLDGDDGLTAKFFTNSICLSVNGRTSCR